MRRFDNGTILTAAALVAVLAVAVACAKKEEAPAPKPTAEKAAVAPEPEPAVATAGLEPRSDTTVNGEVTFTQEGDTVAIVAHIVDAPPGTHGFHVHEVGDCSAPDFTSAGGHFNPTQAIHGSPDDAEHHAGDLGNIEVGEDGTAHVELTSTMLTVEEGPSSVVGRAVILHEKADDFKTQPTGAAGSRLACGVVEIEGMLAEALPMEGEHE